MLTVDQLDQIKCSGKTALYDKAADGDSEAAVYAKAICRLCPVREACLDEHFLDRDVVVGGTTWAERRKMLEAGDYSEHVQRRLEACLHGVQGTIAASSIGLQNDLLQMLRARHDIAA